MRRARTALSFELGATRLAPREVSVRLQSSFPVDLAGRCKAIVKLVRIDGLRPLTSRFL